MDRTELVETHRYSQAVSLLVIDCGYILKIYNLRCHFISIPLLLGSTPALSVSFTDCTLARVDV